MDRQKLREQANRLLHKQKNRTQNSLPRYRNVTPVPIQTRGVVRFDQVVVPPKDMLKTMKPISNMSPQIAKPGEFRPISSDKSKSSEAPKSGCGGCRRGSSKK